MYFLSIRIPYHTDLYATCVTRVNVVEFMRHTKRDA